MTSLTLNGSTTILSAVTYDPFGPIAGWTWGNSTIASRNFDTDGKIFQVDNANGASLKNYAYDNAFRITGIADAADPTLSWTYGYDNLDRLNSASKTGTTQGWTYDANGNRLTQTGTTPSTYTNASSSNRVSSITGSLPRTYAYDSAGNTLSYAGATFSYNNRGRMATASNGGVTATYTYNALGQRIQRTASSVTTLYAYDEAGHLAGEYTSTGALIQETVWLGDIPVATLRPNGSGGVVLFYVHADHLNTPRLVTDTSNNLRWNWESDPFGTTIPNENPSSLGMFAYNLRLPGQQYDAVVGLHYNYFRDYDPSIGRYVESDPIGLWGGKNTYAYLDGDPLLWLDPWGLWKYSPFAGERVSKELEGKITCLEKCLMDRKAIDCELVITGAKENSHSGGADGPHGRGLAIDMSIKKNPGLDGKRDEVKTCYEKCFDKESSYAQEEANPPHFHIQDVKGKGGKTGFSGGIH